MNFKNLPNWVALFTVLGVLIATIVGVSRLVDEVHGSTTQIRVLTVSVDSLHADFKSQATTMTSLDNRVSRIETQQTERESLHTDLNTRIQANTEAIQELYSRLGSPRPLKAHP